MGERFAIIPKPEEYTTNAIIKNIKPESLQERMNATNNKRMARIKGSKDLKVRSRVRSPEYIEKIKQSAIKRAHRKILEFLESD